MQIKITIDCDNAAFDDMPGMEVSRILKGIAGRMLYGIPKDEVIMDINGNKVGKVEVEK